MARTLTNNEGMSYWVDSRADMLALDFATTARKTESSVNAENAPEVGAVGSRDVVGSQQAAIRKRLIWFWLSNPICWTRKITS